MKPSAKSRHLEVMVGGCTASEFVAIREFFERRGYRMTESRHGQIFRLWVELPPRGPRPQGDDVRREPPVEGLSARELIAGRRFA